MRTESRRPSRRAWRRARRVVAGAWLVALAGCNGGPAPDQQSAENKPIVKTAERGPVTMRVTADKGQITLAERLKLTIEVEAAKGVDVEMPRFGEQMKAFAIRDFRDYPPEPINNGGRRWRQTYDLDVFVSGDYPVPELTSHFTDRRDKDHTIHGQVTTEGFTVQVTSLLEGQFDPTKFREIKGPVALPVSRTWVWLWWVAGALAAAGLVLGGGVWFVRRLRREPPEPVVPAHEWAYAELQRLLDEQLIEAGRVSEFYFRLSMIVRVYIERRFRLMAPEWTTQEFLAQTQRSSALPPEHRSALGGFLKACDMVKFALHEPDNAEIEGAFDSARAFIDHTAETAPQSEEAVAA